MQKIRKAVIPAAGFGTRFLLWYPFPFGNKGHAQGDAAYCR